MPLIDVLGAIPHWIVIAAAAGYLLLVCAVSAAVFFGVRRVWDWAVAGVHAVRTRRELRELDSGTCDGLNAREAARLVEELWVIEDPVRD